MSKYEIPLHGFDDADEKDGVFLLIEGDKISLVDYSGEPPHDLIPLYRHEVLRLVQTLTTWMASETKVHNEFSDQYGEYKNE